MRNLVSALFFAAAVPCATPARAQVRIDFRGVPWGISPAMGQARLEGLRYALIRGDTAQGGHAMYFEGPAGERIRADFSAEGLMAVRLWHPTVGDTAAAREFAQRRRALQATLGAGRAGAAPLVWGWAGRDSTALMLTSEAGRVMEQYTSKYAEREMRRRERVAGTPRAILFPGVPWDAGADEASRRLRAQGWRFVGADSTNLNHITWSFRRGRDSLEMMFAPAGVRSYMLVGDSLPEARRVEEYRARLAAYSARYGAGRPGLVEPSRTWIAADLSLLALHVERGRLQEYYISPNSSAISEASRQPRIIRSSPERGTGWYAGRVSAATWRPIHVSDTLAVSWDSAGATTMVERLVTARVRWDWRDVHLVSANPPFDAEEREMVMDCKLVQHDDRAIRYYNGREMVYQVPLGLGTEIRWTREPAGPEWNRIVRALCARVRPGGG